MLRRQSSKTNMTSLSAICITLLATAVTNYSISAVSEGADVGITYGRNAQNLPSACRVVDFLTKDMDYAIPIVRLLDADVQVLKAFRGTNLVLTVTVPNDEIPSVASSQSAANTWVNDHIAPFLASQNGTIRFRYIAVGNEAIPGCYASLVTPAMRNLHQALISCGVPDDVKITTSVSPKVLGQCFPPSACQFEESASNFMRDVTNFVHGTGAPLLINAYPYFALVNDPQHIGLDYALFQAKNPVVIDGEYKYFNLFDAMVDAFVVAMVKVVGQEGVRVVVSETGWPVKGNEPYTCVDNAQKYNRNLKDHVQRVGGTPRMQNYMEVYIYSMFNEDLKPDLVGRNFGTFNKDFTEIYPIWH